MPPPPPTTWFQLVKALNLADVIKALTGLCKVLSKGLHANQRFDIIGDLMMLAFCVLAFTSDLGPYENVLRVVLIILAFVFIFWSYVVNHKIGGGSS